MHTSEVSSVLFSFFAFAMAFWDRNLDIHILISIEIKSFPHSSTSADAHGALAVMGAAAAIMGANICFARKTCVVNYSLAAILFFMYNILLKVEVSIVGCT